MAAIDRSVVADFPIFADLEPATLDAIVREARPIRVPRNGIIFDQGREASSFFLLLHGHVRAAKTTPAGQQVVVRYVTPGEIFGVAPAIGISHYPATATAVDDSIALAWPAPAWPRLFASQSSLVGQALQSIGARLQDSHTRIIEMSTQQVERRVAHTLLRLANQAGRKTAHGIEIDFPISRQDIAQMTGTTLHTVSRTLSAWQDKTWVDCGRQRVVLRDPHQLFKLAEADPADP